MISFKIMIIIPGFLLHFVDTVLPILHVFQNPKKISIRGDGKSHDLNVNDKQLQTANLVDNTKCHFKLSKDIKVIKMTKFQ